MYIQPFGRGRGQREAPVFVEDDEAAIGVQKIGARQTAVAPRDLASLDVDGHKRRRAEITARSEDQFADADAVAEMHAHHAVDRKSTRLNSSHLGISYAVFCLKKKT